MLNAVDAIIGYSPIISVTGAGAVAVSDREGSALKGPVQGYLTTSSDVEYDEKTGKYVEQPSRTTVGKGSFDQFGNLIEAWTYFDGDPIAKNSYSYDGWGLLSSSTSEALYTSGKSDVTQFTPVESIERKMKFTNPAGSFETSNGKWVYDSFGNEVERTSKLIPKTSSLRSYDKNRLLIDEKYYVDGRLSIATRYTYEFDSHGNWVRSLRERFDARFPSIGYVPLDVEYRKLTYFDR